MKDYKKIRQKFAEKQKTAPEKMIQFYEKGALEILKDDGLIDTKEWVEYKPGSSIATDAKEVLANLQAMKHSIERKDARYASLWGALVGEHAARARLRPLEAVISDGQILRENRSKGGQQPKKGGGFILAIDQAVEEGCEHNVNAVWEWLESYTASTSLEIDSYDIYMDGDSLVQIDSARKERSIKKTSFRKYFK